MLSSVKAQNRQVNSGFVQMWLGDPSNGYVVKEIEGLGPVKATLVSSTFANLDGEQYHSSRRDPRNIVIKLELKPSGTATVQSLRKKLYDVFMPKSEVDLRFIEVEGSNTINSDIIGVVETCEPAIFTKMPTMVISILCFQPDFIDPVNGVFSGNTTQGATTPIAYDGSIETGILLTVSVNQTIQELRIQSTPDSFGGGVMQQLQVIAPFNAGDVFTLETGQGKRFAKIYRVSTGQTISGLWAIPPGSIWPQLYQGVNNFRVWSNPNVAVPYSLTWTRRRGGL